ESSPDVGRSLPPATLAAKPEGVRFGVWTGALSVLLALLVGGAVLVQRVLSPVLSAHADGSDKSGAPTGEPIRVGLLYSLHGSLAYSEMPVREATLQAIREVNEAGGVLGRPVKAITEDGGSEEEAFERGAEKLLNEGGVVTIFGCWSSASRKRVEGV